MKTNDACVQVDPAPAEQAGPWIEADDEHAGEQPERRRRRRRTLWAAAAVLAVVAVAATVGVTWSVRVDRDLAAAEARVSTASATLEDAISTVGPAIDAAVETVGDAASPGVDVDQIDEVLGDNLANRLMEAEADAGALLRSVPESEQAWRQRQARTELLDRLADEMEVAATELSDEVGALATAIATWELDQAIAAHDTAVTGLDEGIEQGRSRLADSEGSVLDDAVRVALSAAIDAAEIARVTEVDPQDADTLMTATATLREHIDTLSAARKAVADAQDAWQAEQDRIAAEQAAAATAAAQSARSSSSTSGGSRSASTGSSSGSSRASGSGSPSGTGTGSTSSGSSGGTSSGSSGSGSSGWVEVEGDDYDAGSLCIYPTGPGPC